MKSVLEATLVNGLNLFKNELETGEIRFMLATSPNEVLCNAEECSRFGINEEAYHVVLESCGGESYYYTEYGEEIPLYEHHYHYKMGTRILCDTYFKTRDEAFEAAQILTQIFEAEGSEGLIEYADQLLAELWESLEDVTLNDEEQINSSFHIWPAGTSKEDIWHWFDRSHSKGLVDGLIYA